MVDQVTRATHTSLRKVFKVELVDVGTLSKVIHTWDNEVPGYTRVGILDLKRGDLFRVVDNDCTPECGGRLHELHENGMFIYRADSDGVAMPPPAESVVQLTPVFFVSPPYTPDNGKLFEVFPYAADKSWFGLLLPSFDIRATINVSLEDIQQIRPMCCDRAKSGVVVYRHLFTVGLRLPGWCINVNQSGIPAGIPGGELEGVQYCPYCGEKLPDVECG